MILTDELVVSMCEARNRGNLLSSLFAWMPVILLIDYGVIRGMMWLYRLAAMCVYKFWF